MCAMMEEEYLLFQKLTEIVFVCGCVCVVCVTYSHVRTRMYVCMYVCMCVCLLYNVQWR